MFLQFATGILVIKTAEKHVILKHIFKQHVLNVLHVLNEMVMVCYKTHVDWPYSGSQHVYNVSPLTNTSKLCLLCLDINSFN